MSTQTMIPDWKLERYALGELAPAEMESIAEAVAQSTDLAAKLENLKIDSTQYLQNNDPAAAAKRIKAMVSARQDAHKAPVRTFALWKPLASLAALALAVTVGTSVMTAEKQSVAPVQVASIDLPDNGTRVKGLQNRIELWQKEADSIAMILDGAKVQKGDLLQIRTQVAAKCFAAVLSLDGRGNWTTHLPESGSAAVNAEPSTSGFLPFSYELDDAPRYEVFWLVTSKAAFSVDSLVQSLRALTGSPMPPPVLPLDKRFTQTRIMVRK
jgi:hypothetical protein